MTTPTKVVTSTSDLIPAGLAGYSKGISGFVGLLGAILASVQPFMVPDSEWARYVGLGIAVCGAIGVYLLANTVKPVTVVNGPAVDPAPPGL